MRWAEFKDTLRYSWQMTLIWGIGLGAMTALFVQMTPTLNGMDFVSLLEKMPEWALGAVGVTGDVKVMGTPEGIIAFGLFGKMALIFAAYPVVMGMRATANDEADGILDMVLSQPIPRSQLVLERFLAYALNIIMLILLVIAGVYVGKLGVTLDEPLNTGQIVLVSLNLIPVMIFVLATTIFVGTFVNRRQTVITIMTAFVIASFMIQTLGAMVTASWMDPIEMLSFFSYFNVGHILEDGVVLWQVAMMIVLSVGFLGAALFTFEKRDIAV